MLVFFLYNGDIKFLFRIEFIARGIFHRFDNLLNIT